MRSDRLRRGTLVFTIAAAIGCSALAPRPAAAADPVLMFLLSFARNIIEQHAARRAAEPAALPPLPPVPETYPGTLVEPKLLRRLIDDSFIYLSERQRVEIFESLHASLMNPKNAAVRASLIEYFASTALAVRAMQLRLAQLSAREKQQIAQEFRKEIAELSGDDRTQLTAILRQGLLPVPADLGALLLAAAEQPS